MTDDTSARRRRTYRRTVAFMPSRLSPGITRNLASVVAALAPRNADLEWKVDQGHQEVEGHGADELSDTLRGESIRSLDMTLRPKSPAEYSADLFGIAVHTYSESIGIVGADAAWVEKTSKRLAEFVETSNLEPVLSGPKGRPVEHENRIAFSQRILLTPGDLVEMAELALRSVGEGAQVEWQLDRSNEFKSTGTRVDDLKNLVRKLREAPVDFEFTARHVDESGERDRYVKVDVGFLGGISIEAFDEPWVRTTATEFASLPSLVVRDKALRYRLRSGPTAAVTGLAVVTFGLLLLLPNQRISVLSALGLAALALVTSAAVWLAVEVASGESTRPRLVLARPESLRWFERSLVQAALALSGLAALVILFVQILQWISSFITN